MVARTLVCERVDAQLFALSYDFVGGLAETIALIWPPAGAPSEVSLPVLVQELRDTGKAELPARIAMRLDAMPASERYAYFKLATGALRVGVSARLARLALAEYGGLPLAEVEEIWHGLE